MGIAAKANTIRNFSDTIALPRITENRKIPVHNRALRD
jgi:hypothetical protein